MYFLILHTHPFECMCVCVWGGGGDINITHTHTRMDVCVGLKSTFEYKFDIRKYVDQFRIDDTSDVKSINHD